MELAHTNWLGGGCIGLVCLAIALYAAIHILCSSASPFAKALWIVLLLAFPCGGPILWFFFGPRQSRI